MNPSISRWQRIGTLAILALAILASGLGLLSQGLYNEIPVYRTALFLQDVVILGIGVPALAVGLWLAVRGSPRGQIIWLGSLVFMTYIWASQSLVLAYNDAFLLHVALFALSVFTLASGVLALDPTEFEETMAERLPNRLYVGFLAVTAVALGILWLSELVGPLLTGSEPSGVAQFGPLSKNTYVLDLGLVVPALAVTAVWLARGRDWAYPLTGILVVFAALLAPAITSMTITLLMGGIEMTTTIVVASILPPVVGVIVAGRFLLAIPPRNPRERHPRTGIPG